MKERQYNIEKEKERQYNIEKEKEAEEKLYQFITKELQDFAIPEILTGFMIAIFRRGHDIADKMKDSEGKI